MLEMVKHETPLSGTWLRTEIYKVIFTFYFWSYFEVDKKQGRKIFFTLLAVGIFSD